jgi:hypothetical protein
VRYPKLSLADDILGSGQIHAHAVLGMNVNLPAPLATPYPLKVRQLIWHSHAGWLTSTIRFNCKDYQHIL